MLLWLRLTDRVFLSIHLLLLQQPVCWNVNGNFGSCSAPMALRSRMGGAVMPASITP